MNCSIACKFMFAKLFWMTKLSNSNEADPLSAAFDYEAASEAAYSLGLAGRRVERTLAALRDCHGDADQRDRWLKLAATAVHHYFIQREILGLRRHESVIRDYEIPGEVLARLGAK